MLELLVVKGCTVVLRGAFDVFELLLLMALGATQELACVAEFVNRPFQVENEFVQMNVST